MLWGKFTRTSTSECFQLSILGRWSITYSSLFSPESFMSVSCITSTRGNLYAEEGNKGKRHWVFCHLKVCSPLKAMPWNMAKPYIHLSNPCLQSWRRCFHLEYNYCCHMNLQPQAGLYHWGLWQFITWVCPLLVYATEYFFLLCFILFFVVSCLDLSELTVSYTLLVLFYIFSANLYAGHPEDCYWAKSIIFYVSAWKSLYLFSVCSSSQADHFPELLFFIDLIDLEVLFHLRSLQSGSWVIDVLIPCFSTQNCHLQ